MKRKNQAWINLIFLLVTLLINGLGAMGLIGGNSQKDISDMYITLITPGPSTFSIWSLIYLLLITLVILMIVKSNDAYYKNLIDKISNLYRISCLLNIAWIVLFSFILVELSSIFILAFLVLLTVICRKLLEINDNRHFLAPLSFGMYTGWLFIASVVNISASLVKLEWGGFGIEAYIWASLTLVISVILVHLVNLKLKNAIFPLPIAWAFYGIYGFLKSPDGFSGKYPILQVVALIGIVFLIGSALLTYYKNEYFIIEKN